MNQKLLKGMGMTAMMVFLAGCEEIKFNGSMNVIEPITFAQEGEDAYDCSQKPDWWNCKPGGNIVVNPGQFSAKATLGMASGQEKQIKLEISNAKPPTVIDIKFDKNINTDAHFNVLAAQIKQNFDLTGDIVTNVQNSPEQSGNESCTYQVPQTVCRAATKGADAGLAIEDVEADLSRQGLFPTAQVAPVYPAPYPAPFPGTYPGQFPGQYPGTYPGQYPGQYPGTYPGTVPGGHTPVCQTIWVTRQGYMYVRYYYETTLRDITASFVQNGKTLAGYQGHASDTRTVYTYKSECR